MIQIIRGVYGHYTNGRVVPKDENSDPFELSPEQEARLVAQEVARYVDKAETGEAPIGFDEQPTEKPLEDMTVKELREAGRDLGYSFKVGLTKAEMIECIKHGSPDAVHPDDEGDEPAPTFDAAEAVL